MRICGTLVPAECQRRTYFRYNGIPCCIDFLISSGVIKASFRNQYMCYYTKQGRHILHESDRGNAKSRIWDTVGPIAVLLLAGSQRRARGQSKFHSLSYMPQTVLVGCRQLKCGLANHFAGFHQQAHDNLRPTVQHQKIGVFTQALTFHLLCIANVSERGVVFCQPLFVG